jgi:hypothetical protein
MLKRVLMFSGAGLLAGGLSLVAINHTSAQGPGQPTPPPFVPQYAVIPEPGTEEEIPLELVPLAVRTVAQQAADTFVDEAAITSASFDARGSVPVFELAGAGAGGQAFEVDVFPEGKIEAIELVLDVAEPLPDAVGEALAAYFPGFAPERVARSVRPQPTGLLAVYYEFSGVNAAGAAVEIHIREDGGEVHIVQDTSDDGTATPTPVTTTTTPLPTTPTAATTTPTEETVTPITPTAETATPITPTAETVTPITPTAETVTPTAETVTPIP